MQARPDVLVIVESSAVLLLTTIDNIFVEFRLYIDPVLKVDPQIGQSAQPVELVGQF